METAVQPVNATLTTVRDMALALFSYCEKSDFKGYDPYDALNSRLLNRLPLRHSHWVRLAATQALKRFPWNIRRILWIPKSHNPKGIALFISALVKLRSQDVLDTSSYLTYLSKQLLQLRSPDTPDWCWGYNFDWQMRDGLVKRGSPNIICTTFAGNALLDLYDSNGDPDLLSIAQSAAEFVLELLHTESGTTTTYFRYTPSAWSKIHNANLLGAAYLARVYKMTGVRRFLVPALFAARFSTGKQYPDGSWDYGERDNPSQRWKDNFHTGFNLCALRAIQQFAATSEFEKQIRQGHTFFRQNFFCSDGAPRYYHNASFPFDIHSAAQSIVTLTTFSDLDSDNPRLASSVFNWAKKNMWDKRRRYFYYQKHPWYTNKIPYMRWGQAWMLLALSYLLESDRGTRAADISLAQ